MNAQQRHEKRMEEQAKLAKAQAKAEEAVRIQMEELTRIEQEKQALNRQEAEEQLPDLKARVFSLSDQVVELEAAKIRALYDLVDIIIQQGHAQAEFTETRGHYDQVAAIAEQPEAIESPATRLHVLNSLGDSAEPYALKQIIDMAERARRGEIEHP